MPRLPTCPYCNQVVKAGEPSKKYKNKSYHLSCYQKYCDEVYKTSSNKNTDSSKQELYDYICSVFNLKELSPFLNFQLQKIFKENNFTYNGVLYSLKYFFEIKENPVDINYGVGIVPLIYEEAKNFYIKKSILWEKNGTAPIEKKEKTIKVNSRKKKPKPMIDISKL